MNTLVVFFALASVACGSLVPLAQPAHYPALVLDPHGRPLDTAEVINARALHLQAKALDGHYGHAAVVAPLAHSVVAPVAHSVAVAPAVVAAPAAVSHQSRVDVISSPAVVSHAIAAPVLAHSAPVFSSLGYAAHGHYLHKRSLGHYTYAAPAVIAAPAAVSHQSRVDVISSPAVVSHAVAAPVIAHAAPVVAVAPAAVSHQSRVDVRTSPAVVAHSVVAPIAHAAVVPAAYSAHSALVAPVYGAHAYAHGAYSHLLKKRSLAHFVAPVVHTVPAAVSHQSRVDVISKPAVVATHIAPAVYSAPALYAAPAVSHIAPIAHSAIWTSPFHLKAAHW
ncbi:uncharacterized protein LOC142978485 [Anticarsia gemmatalis]|uniref:uncharacterized protein LOC142978485 n=1 Tax=Anticarsia gemmatalis TaxID=129554 RepID=UPI003F76C16A